MNSNAMRCFLALTLVLSLGVRAGEGAAAKREKDSPEFLIGTTTHFAPGRGSVEANLDLIREFGLGSIRDDMPWKMVERRRGRLAAPRLFHEFVDAAVKRGLKPLGILAYNNPFYDEGGYPRSDEAVAAFVRYAETVAAFGRGKIAYYQVWNEWDGGCGMNRARWGRGDAESYVRLLKAVYPRLKEIHPEAGVICGSVCTGEAFLQRILELGAADFCDFLSIHPYNFKNMGEDGTPEAWFRKMVRVEEFIRRHSGGKEKPFFITEMGYPSFRGIHGRSEEECAANLARLFLLARLVPSLRGMWWYDFQDDGWNSEEREESFGLVRPDLTLKPAGEVMRDISGLVAHGECVGRMEVGNPDVWVLRFRYRGRDVLALWSADAGARYSIVWEDSAGRRTPFEVRRAGAPSRRVTWGWRDWSSSLRNRWKPAQWSITVDAMPQLMTGDFAGIRPVAVVKRKGAPRRRPPRKLPKGIAFAVPEGKPAVPVDLAKEGKYFSFAAPGWQGREDLEASFEFRYTPSNLLLTIRVKDNHFRVAPSAERGWGSDDLQMGFQFEEAGGEPEGSTELDIALTGHGPETFLRENRIGLPRGVTDRVKLSVTPSRLDRMGAPGRHVYQLSLPASLFGRRSFQKGDRFYFSLLINDNDGAGRKGFLHWGDGIGVRKDPYQYNLVILQ